jgi:hypothetical protein
MKKLNNAEWIDVMECLNNGVSVDDDDDDGDDLDMVAYMFTK